MPISKIAKTIICFFRFRHKRRNIMDWDKEELNQDMKEIDSLENKINEIHQYIDTGFEWLELYQNMLQILQIFIKNMESIEYVLDIIPNKDNLKQQFLIATLLSGVISAYEGMVHDFVHLLMHSENYKREENIKKIQTRDLKCIGIQKSKENLSWSDLAQRLQKATLNHPNIVTRIINTLFEFNIPEGDEGEINDLIEMRNDFTHNNGINKEGKNHQLSWDYLSKFLARMDILVATYSNSMQPDVEKFFKNSPE